MEVTQLFSLKYSRIRRKSSYIPDPLISVMIFTLIKINYIKRNCAEAKYLFFVRLL